MFHSFTRSNTTSSPLYLRFTADILSLVGSGVKLLSLLDLELTLSFLARLAGGDRLRLRLESSEYRRLGGGVGDLESSFSFPILERRIGDLDRRLTDANARAGAGGEIDRVGRRFLGGGGGGERESTEADLPRRRGRGDLESDDNLDILLGGGDLESDATRRRRTGGVADRLRLRLSDLDLEIGRPRLSGRGDKDLSRPRLGG